VGEHQEDFNGQDCGEEQQEEEEEDSEEQLSRAAAAVTGRQRNSSVSSSDVVSYFSCYLCKYLFSVLTFLSQTPLGGWRSAFSH
jgi:hypothetical protein